MRWKMIKSVQELKSILERLLKDNECVIISPHINPDVDAMSSSLALYTISKSMGKDTYIVIDDESGKLDSSLINIFADLPTNINIIRPREIPTIISNKRSLLIVSDTNKASMIPIKNLAMFSDLIVIDHHDLDSNSIKGENMCVLSDVSSASEITYELLRQWGIRVIGRNSHHKADNDLFLADYLLSGIVLDTDSFRKGKVSSKTMKNVSKMLSSGASLEFVNDIFRSESTSALRVHGLVSKSDIELFNVAIALNKDDPEMIYTIVELAKAADYLIELKGMDAAFVLGYIKEGLVGISARSKGRIPVGKIMSEYGGGGNAYQAAAKVATNDIKGLKLEIEKLAIPGYKLN